MEFPTYFSKTSLLALVSLGLATGVSQAAITVVDTDFAAMAANQSPGAFTLSDQQTGTRDGIYSYTYNAGASFDMLVLTVSREASNTGENTGGATFSASYAGTAMNLATGNIAGSGVSIFYLETASSSGTIALDFRNFATVNGIGIGIAAISSTTSDPIGLYDADSILDGTGATSTSISINTADDSFTMWAVDTNLGAFSTLPTTQIDKNEDIGNNGYATAYEEVTTGQLGDTYSYTNSNNPRGIAAANFVVIPEPSAALLGSLGLLTLLRRRRS